MQIKFKLFRINEESEPTTLILNSRKLIISQIKVNKILEQTCLK